jgi:hypothetical protein
MQAKTAIFLGVGSLIVTANSGLAETIIKRGTNASGQTCQVTVERHPDGSITAAGSGSSASSTTGSASASSSSSSSGGSASVHIQAGGGTVAGSSSVPGGSGTSSSTITVNGCTISTSSP